MSTETEQPEQFTKPKSVNDWKKAKRHPVVLPSGVEVEIELPNLPLMVKTGQIPNDLIEAAIGAIQRERITKALINEQSDFYNKLVAWTVKVPEISEEDVAELPFEDIEILVELATRQRDIDALGRHIAGLHTSREWRTFRGFGSGDEALEDL